MNSKRTILIVDDDRDTRDGLARALSGAYRTVVAADAESAMAALAADPSIALMLSDVRMPGADGVSLMKAAKAAHPHLAVILLTAYGSIDAAVAAMKDGADDFIAKPVDLDQLELRVEKEMRHADLRNEVKSLHAALDEKYGLEQIVGSSDAMKKVFRTVRQVAPSDATVLLEGPSGTGKEVVAHAIHNLSRRSDGPFVAVHCAALTPTLLESELFGHEKGAFTGAVSRQIGRFEAANGGTLFLDEISEIDPSTQIKLLRVLEDRTFERVGGTETLHTDIRVVAATNRDFKAYVDAGKFREDLYYRLNVVGIKLPPLKDRHGDIPLLAQRFLREYSAKNGDRVKSISPEAMSILEAYPWPGNVRELRNAIEKMVVLAEGERLAPSDVPEEMRAAASLHGTPAARAMPPGGTLSDTEKNRVLAALAANGGNRSRAADALGISRRTIQRKLKEYAIEDSAGEEGS